jgi:hypothetical protein
MHAHRGDVSLGGRRLVVELARLRAGLRQARGELLILTRMTTRQAKYHHRD